MPLIKSASKAAVSKNIATEMNAGKKQAQAVAIALNIARKARANGGGVHVGPLMGATAGRADAIKTKVPDGSHVIPADICAALGQGNNAHGQKILFGMFPWSKPLKARKPKYSDGGAVPVMLSDGEFVVSPQDVARIGDGNAENGHQILDHFILHVRNQNINNLKNLPGPEKD